MFLWPEPHVWLLETLTLYGKRSWSSYLVLQQHYSHLFLSEIITDTIELCRYKFFEFTKETGWSTILKGPICDNQRTLLILLGTSTLFYFKNPLQSCCNGFTVKIALHHCGCYWYSSSLQRGARRLLLHGSQICWTALSWLQTCAWGI